MFARTTQSFLNKILVPSRTTQMRQFSTAAGINSRFEEAYLARTESLSKGTPKM